MHQFLRRGNAEKGCVREITSPYIWRGKHAYTAMNAYTAMHALAWRLFYQSTTTENTPR